MLLLARSGQRSAALVQYEACRRALDEELGAEPAKETVGLYRRLAAGPPRGPEEGPERPEDGSGFSGRRLTPPPLPALPRWGLAWAGRRSWPCWRPTWKTRSGAW